MTTSAKQNSKYVFSEIESNSFEYYKLEHFRGYISRSLLSYIELILRENMKIDDIVVNEDSEYESVNRFLELAAIRRMGYDPGIVKIKLKNNSYLTPDDLYYARLFILPFYDIREWLKSTNVTELKELALLVDSARETGFNVQVLFDKRKDNKFFSGDEVYTILKRCVQGVDVSLLCKPVKDDLYWDEFQMSVILGGMAEGMTYEDLVFLNGQVEYLSALDLYKRKLFLREKRNKELNVCFENKNSELNIYYEKDLNILLFVEYQLSKTKKKEDIDAETVKEYAKKILSLKSPDFSVLKKLTKHGGDLEIILSRLTPNVYKNSILLNLFRQLQEKRVDIDRLLRLREDNSFWNEQEIRVLAHSRSVAKDIDSVTLPKADGTYWNAEEIRVLLEAFRVKFPMKLFMERRDDNSYWGASEMAFILGCFKNQYDWQRLLKPDTEGRYMNSIDMEAITLFNKQKEDL